MQCGIVPLRRNIAQRGEPMRARTYIDHVDNAGHFYEMAAEVLGRGGADIGTEDYARAKGFMEMSTLALDLAREVRLCEAAAVAQERALMAERERAEKAAGKRGGAKPAQGKAEAPNPLAVRPELL